jgi:hypothetical protein
MDGNSTCGEIKLTALYYNSVFCVRLVGCHRILSICARVGRLDWEMSETRGDLGIVDVLIWRKLEEKYKLGLYSPSCRCHRILPYCPCPGVAELG